VERVAQLLDDLEDLVSALPLLWERIRRVAVRIGLAAAISVSLADILVFRLVPVLALLVLTIILAWCLALGASQAVRLCRQGIRPAR